MVELQVDLYALISTDTALKRVANCRHGLEFASGCPFCSSQKGYSSVTPS